MVVSKIRSAHYNSYIDEQIYIVIVLEFSGKYEGKKSRKYGRHKVFI